MNVGMNGTEKLRDTLGLGTTGYFCSFDVRYWERVSKWLTFLLTESGTTEGGQFVGNGDRVIRNTLSPFYKTLHDML